MAIDAHNFAKADTSANLDYYSTAEGLAEAKVCSHVLPVLCLWLLLWPCAVLGMDGEHEHEHTTGTSRRCRALKQLFGSRALCDLRVRWAAVQ